MFIVSRWDYFFGFLIHKLGLSLVFLISSITFMTMTSQNVNTALNPQALKIEFSNFSPAFAALEDEYLWASESEESTMLMAGEKKWDFSRPEKKETLLISRAEPRVEIKTTEVFEATPIGMSPVFNSDFDGQIVLASNSKNQLQEMAHASRPSPKETAQKDNLSDLKIDHQEMSFGSLANMVRKEKPSAIQAPTPILAADRPQPTVKETLKDSNEELTQKDHVPSPTDGLLASRAIEQMSLGLNDQIEKPKSYKVQGDIELKEGLAFVGSIGISWVVSDYELMVGSINIKDASFEISPTELVGEIIVSLYDQYDEMIGEGRIDLSEYHLSKTNINAKIPVYPVDLNTAGKVVEVASLGSQKMKTIEGADVDLYAFNNRSTTNKNGEFSFRGWKKSNSRTLAIASKKGYKDSVFLIDSKKTSTVILFDNKYVDAFFDYLSDIGLRSKRDKGTIYGHIVGVGDASGYRVRLEKEKPLYFIEAGFPTQSLNQTSSNGLFAFVGLQDGDYILRIEKEGEIIDEKVVIVEQGKISPVYADLAEMKKHLAFYDPFFPEKLINEVELRFFDGYQVIQRNQQNTHDINIRGGNDAGILDFYESEKAARTFISRQKSVQKIPLLRDKVLMKLAEVKNLDVSDGIIFGFIESPEKYRVEMVEEKAENIIYFNASAQPIDPTQEVAFGFMMGGFSPGLKTIVIESVDDPMILATDLVFSDHNIISLINTQIFLAQ